MGYMASSLTMVYHARWLGMAYLVGVISMDCALSVRKEKPDLHQAPSINISELCCFLLGGVPASVVFMLISMLWKFISEDGRRAPSSGDAITQRAISIGQSFGNIITHWRSLIDHLGGYVFDPVISIHDSAVSTQQQVGSTQCRPPEAAQAEIPDRQLDPNAETSSMFEPEDESNSRLPDDLQKFHETDERKSPANSEGRDGSQAYLDDDEQQRQIMDEYILPATETIPEDESIFGMRAVLYPDAAQRARLHIWNEFSPRPPARAREDTSREVTPQVRMLHRKSPLRRIGVNENPVRFSNGKESYPIPSTKVPKTSPIPPMIDFAPTSAGGFTTANTLFSSTPLQSSPSITLLSPNSPGPVSTDSGCNDRPIEKQDSGYLSALLNTPTPVRVQTSVKGTHHLSDSERGEFHGLVACLKRSRD